MTEKKEYEQLNIGIESGNYNESIGGNYIQNIFNYPPSDSQKLTGIPQKIPHSGVAKFVGRQQELETLHRYLQQTNQVAISAITGMGGIGKTELALQYAQYHYQQKTYLGGICWLQVRGENIGIQILSFARAQLDLQPPENWDLQTRVDYCWRRWREGDVLVVWDDVTEYRHIKPYLPPNEPRFKILITTRVRLGSPIMSLNLDVLTSEAALELLQSLVEKERVNAELEAAKALCEWLGYLPLGLELVGRYLAKRKTLSLAEMLSRLQNKSLGHKSLAQEQAEMTASLGVKAAFELSWEELNNDPKAQELACLLSLVALAPIPWQLVEMAVPEVDPEDLEFARDALEDLHLVKCVDEKEESYQLHQLIREFFQEKLEQSEQADEQKQNVVAAVVKVSNLIPQTDFLTRQQVITLSPAIPHLTEVVKHLTNYFSSDSDIFRAIGNFYYGQGFHSQAQTWYEQCLTFKKSRFGSEHPKVAMSLNYLGYCYFALQRCKEAEQLFQQALAITKRQLGEENLDTALFTNNLANNYFRQGHYKEAQLLHQEALAIAKRQLGEEHPRVALILSTLGELYQTQGLYTEAEPLYQEALAIRQGQFGNEHPDVAYSLKMLANIYRLQGRYKEAEPFYLQAVEIWFNKLGTEHPLAVTDINNFTDFLRQVVKEGRESDLSDNSQVQTLISEIRTNPEESE